MGFLGPIPTPSLAAERDTISPASLFLKPQVWERRKRGRSQSSHISFSPHSAGEVKTEAAFPHCILLLMIEGKTLQAS